MFSTILFAASGSAGCDPASLVAFDLSVRLGARLVLAHVIEPETQNRLVAPSSFMFARDAEEAASAMGERFAPRMRSGVDCAVAVSSGEAAAGVLSHARMVGADLIVMGIDSGEGREVGPTVRSVLASSEVPVMTVSRPTNAYWGGFSDMVFCADFSASAEVAFANVLGMAASSRTRLRVFHALEEAAEAVSAAECDGLMLAARERLCRCYLGHVGGEAHVSGDVWEGCPAVEIVKYARERQADLIVVAPERRVSGVGRTLEQVLLRATCPVLVVDGSHRLGGSKRIS